MDYPNALPPIDPVDLDPPRDAGPSRRTYTRTKATSVSFSWWIKLAWSAPPILFVVWLARGGLSSLFSPLAWFLGVLTIPYVIWWLRQVWIRTPVVVAAVDSRAERSHPLAASTPPRLTGPPDDLVVDPVSTSADRRAQIEYF